MKAKKIQIIYLILLLALVIQPGCKKSEVGGVITGITWVLDTVSFSAVNTVQVNVPVTLLLDDDGALFLELDCNFCSGTYELGQDDTFEFLQIGWCTEAYCGPDSPDREIHAAGGDSPGKWYPYLAQAGGRALSGQPLRKAVIQISLPGMVRWQGAGIVFWVRDLQ